MKASKTDLKSFTSNIGKNDKNLKAEESKKELSNSLKKTSDKDKEILKSDNKSKSKNDFREDHKSDKLDKNNKGGKIDNKVLNQDSGNKEKLNKKLSNNLVNPNLNSTNQHPQIANGKNVTSNRSLSGHRKNAHIEKVPKKMTDKRAEKILKNGGMLDAYKYVMESICKSGLPSGDLFEFAAYSVQNFEKKWKEIRAKEIKDKINKFKVEKFKDDVMEMAEKDRQNDKNPDKLNKSVEYDINRKSISELKRSHSARKMKSIRERSKSPKLRLDASMTKDNSPTKNGRGRSPSPKEIRKNRSPSPKDINTNKSPSPTNRKSDRSPSPLGKTSNKDLKENLSRSPSPSTKNKDPKSNQKSIPTDSKNSKIDPSKIANNEKKAADAKSPGSNKNKKK